MNERQPIIALCDKRGRLNLDAIQFSKTPYIRANVMKRSLKTKHWNYLVVYGEEAIVTFAIAQIGFSEVATITFFDLETERFTLKEISIPFSRKSVLSETLLEDISFTKEQMHLQMIQTGKSTRIVGLIPQFDNERLHIDLEIHEVADESIHVVIPKSVKEFQYTGKQLSLPTSGHLVMGNKKYTFDEQYCYSIMDFTRGIWPRKMSRNWAMASQRYRGKRVGLNFSNGWTDRTGMYDNAWLIDGQIHMINEEVVFEGQENELLIRSRFSNRVSLTFHPFSQHEMETKLVLGKIEMSRMNGYYEGHLTKENGEVYPVRQLLGSVEKVETVW